MNKEHTYMLQPYKGANSRYACPACNHKHKFTRYVHVSTGEIIADHVGRCDREDSCGYHFKPKDFFASNPGVQKCSGVHDVQGVHNIKPVNTPTDYLPFDLFSLSVEQHRRCCLYPFLEKLFRENVADYLCTNYFVGANRAGNTVFWQVDREGNVRQSKVMLYDSATGRRNRDTGAFFAGKKILNNPDANLQQCFFGEFLLSVPENIGKPIAIVESEKSCLIASVYYPNFIWLATGGKNGAKWTEKNVCKVLKGKRVILFPDLGAYDLWSEKGKLLANVAGCTVATSDVLEINATEAERKQGLDIADYLLREQDSTGLALTDHQYPIIWDYRINSTETISLPEATWENTVNNINN